MVRSSLDLPRSPLQAKLLLASPIRPSSTPNSPDLLDRRKQVLRKLLEGEQAYVSHLKVQPKLHLTFSN